MENTITLRHASVAYLAAVTASAACGTLTFGIELGKLVSLDAPILFGYSWLCALVGGLLQSTVAIRIANRTGIRNKAYFVASGAVAALAALAVAVAADAYACGDEPAPLEMFAELALHLAASGAAGGAAGLRIATAPITPSATSRTSAPPSTTGRT